MYINLFKLMVLREGIKVKVYWLPLLEWEERAQKKTQRTDKEV
jgi:hypothetical protein